MGKLIVLEGMPGAGKTTLANYLSKQENIQPCYALEQFVIDETLSEDIETSIQYIDAEFGRIREAQALTLENQLVILDRSLLATLAFRYAKSQLENRRGEYIKLLNYLYAKARYQDLKPDLLIIMDVSIEQSLNRRKEFSRNPLYRTWFDREFLFVFQDFYINQIPDILIANNNYYIDTTNLSADETANNIVSLLDQRKYLK